MFSSSFLLASARCAAFAAAVAGWAFLAPTAASAADGSVSLELNKLEPQETGCRAYMLLQNGTQSNFEELRLDIAIFDTNGIVSKRLAVEAAPLPVDKTSLKLFTMTGVACEDVGRMLLNNVLSCVDQSGERGDCVPLLEVSTRTSAAFIK